MSRLHPISTCPSLRRTALVSLLTVFAGLGPVPIFAGPGPAPVFAGLGPISASAGPAEGPAHPAPGGAAESPQGPDGAGEAPAGAAGPESFLSRLTVHGYLTQAYADATDFGIFGIPTDGTFDYRLAAVQFRYDLGPKDTVILQFSHESLGDSATEALRDDVEVDWAFYEHRFEAGTALRIGKVQIPFGLLNETRDVGVLLPFFRAPTVVYGEEFFTSETLDGIVASHSFGQGSGWDWTLEGYAGGWDVIENNTVNLARVDRAAGAQAWLIHPHETVRFGAGFRRSRITDLLSQEPEDTDYWSVWHVSAEAVLGRFKIQGELRDTEFEEGGQQAFYAHVGVDLSQRWSLSVQAERATFDFAFQGGFLDLDLQQDDAIGLRFAISPQAVVKLEHHLTEGFFIDDRPPGFFPRFLANDTFETEYSILSLSASF